MEENYIQIETIDENAEADLERNKTVLQTHGLCWEAVASLNGSKMFGLACWLLMAIQPIFNTDDPAIHFSFWVIILGMKYLGVQYLFNACLSCNHWHTSNFQH